MIGIVRTIDYGDVTASSASKFEYQAVDHYYRLDSQSSAHIYREQQRGQSPQCLGSVATYSPTTMDWQKYLNFQLNVMRYGRTMVAYSGIHAGAETVNG